MAHTLLIVDDDERLLGAMKRVLRKEGYNLMFARDGREALEKLQRRKADLIVSDYHMPGMDGLTFLEQVKTSYPAILTIMMTGVEDVNVAMKAINDAGVYKFLLKPCGSEMLKVNIRRALETLELIRERDALLEKIKARDALLSQLEKEHPGITEVKRDEDGFIIG